MDLENDFIDLKNCCIDLNWHASAKENSPLLPFEEKKRSNATAGRRSFLITDLKTSLLALKVAQFMMSNLGKYLDIPALMPK